MSTPRTWRVGSTTELADALYQWRVGDVICIAAGVVVDAELIYTHVRRGSNVGAVIIDEIYERARVATDKPNRGPYASHQPWKARKHHG